MYELRIGSLVKSVAHVGTIIGVDDDGEQMTHVTVRWNDGRVERLNYFDADIEDVTPIRYVNLYRMDRRYGGPEEGGWWYDQIVPLTNDDDYYDEPPFHGWFPTDTLVETQERECRQWAERENANRPDIGSVASTGVFVVRVESWPASPEPAGRPYYC